MNEQIKALLEASDAPAAVKTQALGMALEISTGIAYRNASMAAGGQFLALLMQLLQMLLPLLLDLLKPKV